MDRQDQKTHLHWLSLLPGALILVLIAGVIGVVAVKRRYVPNNTDLSKPTGGAPERKPPNPLTNNAGAVTYAPANFQFTPEPGWVDLPPEKIFLPDQFNGAKLALTKESSGCVMAYLHTFGRDNYTQTSFGGLINSQDQNQLASSWYTPKENVPDGFKFANHQRMYFNGEVRYVYYPPYASDRANNRWSMIILYNQSGRSVANDCDEDFSKMLASFKTVFEQITITPISTGYAYIYSAYEFPTTLMFVPNEDFIARKVMELDIDLVRSPVVYKNEIYAISNNQLVAVDPFSKKVSVVPGILNEDGKTINDIFFINEKIFYLYGSSCTGYLEKCALQLVEYDFATKQSSVLTGGVGSRSIVQYDSTAKSLRMMHSEGDAGCFWQSAEEYNFDQHTLKKIGGRSGCEGEPDNTTDPSAATWFEKLDEYREQNVQHSVMRVDKGNVSLPVGEVPYFGNAKYITYPLE